MKSGIETLEKSQVSCRFAAVNMLKSTPAEVGATNRARSSVSFHASAVVSASGGRRKPMYNTTMTHGAFAAPAVMR